jgi:hypothetical protein
MNAELGSALFWHCARRGELNTTQACFIQHSSFGIHHFLRKDSQVKNGLLLLQVSLLSVMGLSAGCATAVNQDLVVTSHQSGQAFTQHFAEGYIDRDSHGDTDIVLASDADHVAGRPGVLKQVMHMRVMWHSNRVTKWEGAPDTNASIRWYVFTDHAGQPEMIEYAGTGTVTIHGDPDNATVSVENAQLHPTFNYGTLSDPIGPSKFEGTVAAVSNRARVDELLSEVRTTLAATSLPQQPVEVKTAEARIAP